MGTKPEITAHAETFEKVKQVRAQALEAYRRVQELNAQRRDLLRKLVEAGFSQTDIAGELGVSRQAIQKMIA